jgi:hypothetical protein
MIGARRAVARHLGLKLGEAESSGRCGVVHFHALLRLDADGARATGRNDLIVSAMRTAIARTTVGHPTRPDEPIRWGLQADLTPIDTEDRPRLAWYVAKYATKSVDTGGALDQRIHHGDLAGYPLPDHLRRLAETAWALGGDPELESLNLRHWAHTLGYRGHWLTNSRTWSTTVGRLRQDRYDWQARRNGEDGDDELIREGDWTYEGTGHQNEGDLWLSQVAHLNHQTNRRTAWEERRDDALSRPTGRPTSPSTETRLRRSSRQGARCRCPTDSRSASRKPAPFSECRGTLSMTW